MGSPPKDVVFDRFSEPIIELKPMRGQLGRPLFGEDFTEFVEEIICWGVTFVFFMVIAGLVSLLSGIKFVVIVLIGVAVVLGAGLFGLGMTLGIRKLKEKFGDG